MTGKQSVSVCLFRLTISKFPRYPLKSQLGVRIAHLVVDPDAAVALGRARRRDGLDEDPQLLQPGVGANTHPDDAQAKAVRTLVLCHGWLYHMWEASY